MRPEPTPEQGELRAAVREVLTREVTPDRLLRWEADGPGYDSALREQVARLGWIGLGVPQESGGSGAGLVEVANLLESCAYGLLPRPLIGAIRGAAALALADHGARDLASLSRGKTILALAVDEKGARAPESFTTRLSETGGRIVLEGEKAYVPDGAEADLHLVAARRDGKIALALVARDAASVTTESLRSFGNDRQAHVRYAGAPVLAVVGDAHTLAAVQKQQTALALAEMVGGMSAVLDMTVQYVKEREQFGQKIAIFQAVRHQVADMGTRFTAARHLAWQAISRVSNGGSPGLELPTAVAYVGQAFKHLCWAGHHLHGGAGFVVEHRLRFHSERAQSLCVRFTPEAPALAAIAEALLD